MLTFRKNARQKSALVRRTNFGVEIVVKGLGRVHNIVSAAFTRGLDPLETLAEDKAKAEAWIKANGFHAARPADTRNFTRRTGRALIMPKRYR